MCVGGGEGGGVGRRCGHGLPAELERVIINLYVSRGPNHLNHKWSTKELNLCLLMKIKDLEVRGSSRVVSLDKALCSSFSILARVYKWVPATQLLGGRSPYNGLYGRGSARKGYLFQASGIRKSRDLTPWSIRKGRKICNLGLWKGLKEPTDEFYGCIKSRKRSFFVIDSYCERQCIYSS